MASTNPRNIAITVEAAAAESVVYNAGQFILQQEEGSPYDAPVIHAARAADSDIPVVHDPSAQAAQAIAASVSAYNIPTNNIMADAAYAGYAVEQSHNPHNDVHANSAAAQHHATATATGMEYMALAASAAAPGPGLELFAASTVHGAAAPAMHGFTPNIHAAAAAAVEAQQQTTMTAHELPTPYHLQGRHSMDMLLQEQRRALVNLNLAEDEFKLAQERLAKAKQAKISVDERVNANAESLMEELLSEKSKWNEMYRRLAEYQAEHGHCHVMRNPKRNKSVGRKKKSNEKANLQSLGTWVGQVRLDARRPVGHPDRLEPYKIISLGRLGFDWQPRENYWMDMYEQLKVYLAKSGGKMPPRFVHNQKFALGQWCDTQLDNYRKFNSGKKGAYITQDKIDLLNKIGFIWDKRGQLWKDNYERLNEFRAQHGHCNATASNNGGDKSFGTWVTKQKRKYGNWKRGETKSQELSLTDEQAALMDAIGFGESVEVDGRRLRGSDSKPSRPAKAMKYSLLNGTIAGLVNASEKIEGGSEGLPENVQQPQDPADTLDMGTSVHVMDENYNNTNMDPAAVANNWGDSANAVSLLVDAIMNKESQVGATDSVDGVNAGATHV